MTPLRNYFLDENNYINIKLPPGDIMYLLAQRFGELMRKMWNPRNFKAHVSPHEMLQAVVLCSKKKFQITEQGKVYLRVCKQNQISTLFVSCETGETTFSKPYYNWLNKYRSIYLSSQKLCQKTIRRITFSRCYVMSF